MKPLECKYCTICLIKAGVGFLDAKVNTGEFGIGNAKHNNIMFYHYHDIASAIPAAMEMAGLSLR